MVDFITKNNNVLAIISIESDIQESTATHKSQDVALNALSRSSGRSQTKLPAPVFSPSQKRSRGSIPPTFLSLRIILNSICRMTSLLRPTGVFSHQIASRISQLEAIPKSCANRWSRVVFNNSACLSTLLQFNTPALRFSHGSFRTFATKPKAHTGRVVASKRKPAVARSDEAAGTPKKASAKKAPARKAPAKKASLKKSPAKRRATTKKPAAKKPGRKPESKTEAPPVRRRRALTEKQQAAKEKKNAIQKTRDLKKIALLEVPKRLPSTAYIVLFTETSGKGTRAIQSAKDAAVQYKNLNPEEMEVLIVGFFGLHPLLTNILSV